MSPAPAELDLPADWLATHPRLPEVCVQHGLAQAQRVDFVVKSRPKVSRARRLLVPGYTALDRAGEYLGHVKFVKVQDWPLCARCLRRRHIGLAVAAFLFFGGLVAMIAAGAAQASVEGGSKVLAIPFFLGFVAIVASPWPFSYAGLPKLTHTQAAPDGTAVRVTHPHPEFARHFAG
ncbi:hypothetical protein EV385_4071 [Krasilnikovia cinnamomea]|uniref:Uncharacterized protein n=1 Tax=Krasilnikovia cinnamomea TaxID=349313 RepID=A0A4Q7ZNH5_9ACTN|nr:hypothetical protein [Krasilnikovia cinnamomea]RZU52224.1 hypothetical protein EV385_4071 [Krasilnikovia cinnamomea]